MLRPQMALRESPYWWSVLTGDAAPDPPLPERADVVVVGSGYTGLAAALHLAEGGASVLVLEKETLGFGASSRNGGQVLTGLKVPPRTLLERFGPEKARALHGSSLLAIDSVEKIISDHQIDCGFQRCGHLEAAFKPSHFERFKRDRDLLASTFHHVVELVPREHQRSEIGSDFYHGLLFDPGSGALQPARYVHGLAAAARRAGAILRERSPALEIHREGQGFRVRTRGGFVKTRNVFVATNGYTDLPPFRKRLIPVGSYIIATAPLPPEVASSLIPHRRAVFDSKNFLYYFRLSDDNRLLFGGRAQWTPATPRSTRSSMRILQGGLVEVFPALAGTEVEWAWSGNVCFTRDLLPRAGCLDGVFYAMGYGGHGVAMATHLGLRMADLMLGREDHNPFRDLPFEPIPFYDGRPWFLPFVGCYYKVRDWIQ
jgi:glycine/D-amino acid oxidase-like deaminating enzyme